MKVCIWATVSEITHHTCTYRFLIWEVVCNRDMPTCLYSTTHPLHSPYQHHVQPGLAASITYRDQELWSKGLGVTTKGGRGGTPNTTTIYRIASVSKVFAVSCQRSVPLNRMNILWCPLQALLVYQLYDRGLIRSLDDPLKMFCSEFHIDNPYTADEVTLRQIMSYVCDTSPTISVQNSLLV